MQPIELIQLAALFGIPALIMQARPVRSAMFRLMEWYSVKMPIGGRMHAPFPETDMRDHYQLPDKPR